MMKELLDGLEKIRKEIDKLEEPSKEDLTSPYPPATESEIKKREAYLKFKFPQSYIEFLKLHNGWSHFFNDVDIFGVNGKGYSKPMEDWKSYLKIFEKSFRRRGKDYVNSLKIKEKSDKSVVYLPNHVPFATNYNGRFWVFDKNRKIKDEYSIAVVDMGDTVEHRYDSFTDFVQDFINRSKKQLSEAISIYNKS